MTFGERIKLVRFKLKETQTEFGKRFGVKGVAVSLWESENRKAPYKTLYFVEDFLKNWTLCRNCDGTGWLKKGDSSLLVKKGN